MTEKLSKNAFDKARCFIEQHARDLERTRFAHHFGNQPGNAVYEALKEYQNPDNGFGRALEPDLRTPDSSVLCTSIAFQILRATEGKADPTLVSSAMTYLLHTLNSKTGHWRIIPKAAESYPHAPWWNQAGREEHFDAFGLNPTAEILGYLYDYAEHVPVRVITQATKQVMENISALETIEMHDLLCCLRLLRTKSLPKAIHKRLLRDMKPLVDAAVAWEPEQWQGYALQPLQVIQGPSSPFMAGHEQAVAANLDQLIDSQDDDGSWPVSWSWGDAYPEAWPKARREWAGCLTLANLLVLRAFDRITTEDDKTGRQ